MRHQRDYLERTIATVRNHREADNCWPQWANIFADEIERLWAVEDAARTLRDHIGPIQDGWNNTELLEHFDEVAA